MTVWLKSAVSLVQKVECCTTIRQQIEAGGVWADVGTVTCSNYGPANMDGQYWDEVAIESTTKKNS